MILLAMTEAGFAQEQTPAEALQSPIRTTEIREGALVITSRSVESTRGEIKIVSVSFPADKFDLGLALPSATDAAGSSLQRFLRNRKALVAATGGYLKSYAPATPAGLVKAGGKVINDLSPNDEVLDGIVCFGAKMKGSAIILPIGQYEKTADLTDCIQAGPILALSGQGDRSSLEKIDATLKFAFSQNSFARTFLVTNGNNDTVIGVTSPVSLYLVQDILLLPESKGGFGASAAIMLSGTRTAGLVVDSKPEFSFGNVETLLPNALIVHRR
jgi:hypothetical protein